MLRNLNLVPFVVFETLVRAIIVLRISRADLFSVNYAEFPKMTAKLRLVPNCL